jgi:hypothetical protein
MLLLSLLISSCAGLPEQIAAEFEAEAHAAPSHYGPLALPADAPGRQRPDAHSPADPVVEQPDALLHGGLPLSSGQIIVSERANAGSLFVSLAAEQFRPFIHAGVIVIEEGKPYVYDEFGSMRPALTGPPTDGMRGSVRRVPLKAFLRSVRIAAIYDVPAGVDAGAVAEFARVSRAARKPFDPYFDARSSDRLYCTEFVARALEAGGATAIRETPLRDNASYAVVLAWLKIRAPGLILAGDLVSGEPVALLSRRYSPAQIAAYFELKRELHRRYSADQRLANVFEWSRMTGLHLRPRVREYLDEGIRRAAAGKDLTREETAAYARQLAADMLGPLPDRTAATIVSPDPHDDPRTSRTGSP